VRGGAAARRPAAAGRCSVAACLCGVAALLAGCGDSASPEAAAPRVVTVLGAGSEAATGFAMGDGRVLTVAHAVERGADVRVRAGRAAPRRARVLRRDVRTDLALLAVPRLRGTVPETATTSNEGNVSVLVVRDGRVVTVPAAVRRAIDASVSAAGAERPLRRPALELEARLRAGDSGAPVVTGGGELAGVVFARSRNHPDTAYAVDAQAVTPLLDTE
jgi:S1-C subfamily serine protease